TRRESRRISYAIVALVVLTFVLLNVVIYQSARKRLVTERWDQLVSSTEDKRQALRDILVGLKNEAKFIASGDKVATWARAAANPADAAAPLPALEFERDLDRAEIGRA